MSNALAQLNALPRLTDLPDDPVILRGVLMQVMEMLGTANGKITELQQKIEQMVRQLYGRKSEKWDPNQAIMDELLATVLEHRAVSAKEEAPVAEVKIDAHTRKVHRHGRTVFPETLKHEEIVIPVPEAERICPVTGQERPVIGYDISKKLDYRQPELVVKVYKREKRGSVANAEEAGVVTAPVLDSVVPKSVMGDGLLAHVAVSKFVDHLPLARQEQIFSRQGVALSRQTMCDNLMAASGPLSMLVERIKAKIMASEVIHHDDTPVDMQLDRVAHPKGIKEARLWVATVPARSGPWTCYTFSDGRHARNIEEFFKDYRGSVMSDDYAGYGWLPEYIQQLRCMTHTRRKFFDAQSSHPLEAAEMLERIRILYQLERSIDPGVEYDAQRLLMRQEMAVPQLVAMEARLKAWALQVPPKSPLGKAITYAVGNWACLTRYVEDPRYPLDNNQAEQMIRPLAVGRKNWLFMGSEKGGHAAAVYMTLMATCKRAKVNPWDYLKDVFGRIMSHPVTQLDDLLPGIWKPLAS